MATRVRPIIRVFVSSTFSDLKLERDALAQRVFPTLAKLCLKDGFQFQAIDLRWGVSTQAGLDHRTMQICLEELHRSQEVSPEPNFLILLGDRYGWRPLPEEISATEFQNLEQFAGQRAAAGQQSSPIDVLRQWYRLDENALTPVYILQPRRKQQDGDLDGLDYTTAEAWRDVEQVLWPIINRAFPAKGMKDRFSIPATSDGPPSIVRFQASATEQEIWAGALSVPNAARHVRAFFRDITNRGDFSADEVREFFDLNETNVLDVELAEEQKELKSAIRMRLGNEAVATIPFTRLKRENGKTVIDSPQEGIQKFCDEVQTRLWTIIERQINEFWEPHAPDAAGGQPSSDMRTARELEIERNEHLRVGNERGSKENFVGRTNQLAQIRAYIANDSPLPLVIHGDSGCGKTALLARAFDEIPKEQQPIIRFIGVTPRSSDLRGLLTDLCQELRRQNPIEGTVPTGIRELIDEFQEHVGTTPETTRQPLILFLDALDQIAEADNARCLYWIPTGPLPPHVKLVLSCLSDRNEGDPVGQPFIALQKRTLPAENMLNLDALSIDDAKKLLFDRWLRSAGRKLNEAQQHLALRRLEAKACRQPLYLKLLFEEVRLWRSYDRPPDPGDSVPALLEQQFARLSLESNHGPRLIERALGYIAAARRGLSDSEILEVLFADREYRRTLLKSSLVNKHRMSRRPKRIPAVIWSRLRSDLAPYLAERAAPGGDVLTLYHRQVAEWVKARFVDTVDWNPHRQLADFFERQPLWFEADTDRTSNARKADELPWQRIQAADWHGVERILCDLKFIEAKCSAGMTFELVRDYSAAMEALPEFQQERAAEHERLARLRQYGDGLIAFAKNEGQLPIPPDTKSTQEALPMDEATTSDWLENLIQRSKKVFFKASSIRSDMTRRVGGPKTKTRSCPERVGEQKTSTSGLGRGGIRIQKFANFVSSHSHWFQRFPDQTLPIAYNHAADGVVVESATQLIGDWTTPWLRRNPRPPAPAENPLLVRSLVGHTKTVNAVALTPDGTTVVSASSDKTIRVWDTFTGQILRVFAGHRDVVNSVALTPDGKTAVSGSGQVYSDDHTVRVWDIGYGTLRRTLEGHSGQVNSVAITPDGRIVVSASADKTLRVWNVATGRANHILRGHEGPVNAVAISADGRLAISASGGSYAAIADKPDFTLRVWDIPNGKLLRTIDAPSGQVASVALAMDGVLAVSLGGSNELTIWDVTSGQVVQSFRGKGRFSTSLGVSPDGRTGVVAGGDHELNVWDLGTGILRRTFRGGVKTANAVTISADGRTAISGGGDHKGQETALRVWNLTGHDIRAQDSSGYLIGVSAVAIGCDRATAITSTWDGNLHVWRLGTGERIRTLKGHNGPVGAIAASPNGPMLVSASYDKSLRVWDYGTGKTIHILKGHEGFVTAVALTPNGRMAVSGDYLGLLRAWDLKTGRCLWTADGDVHPAGLITPDGTAVISTSAENELCFRDLATGSLIQRLAGRRYTDLKAFSPDGATAISGGLFFFELWEIASGTKIRDVAGHAENVGAAVVTPNGELSVTGSWDGQIRVWNIGTGSHICTLEGHSHEIKSIVLTPDGTRVISTSADQTVRIWDIGAARSIAVYPVDSPCSCLAVPSEKQVVVGTDDGEMHFLTLQTCPSR